MAHIRKDAHYGWTVTTYFDFRDAMKIKVLTMKRSSGNLVTTVSAMHQDGAFESHMVYRDFSKTMASDRVRVTEKAAMEQHNRVVAMRDDIIRQVTEHYAEKVEMQ
jgi:hypothetical protein